MEYYYNHVLSHAGTLSGKTSNNISKNSEQNFMGVESHFHFSYNSLFSFLIKFLLFMWPSMNCRIRPMKEREKCSGSLRFFIKKYSLGYVSIILSNQIACRLIFTKPNDNKRKTVMMFKICAHLKTILILIHWNSCPCCFTSTCNRPAKHHNMWAWWTEKY